MLPSHNVAYILGNTFALSLYFNSFSFMFEYVNISKDLTKKKDNNSVEKEKKSKTASLSPRVKTPKT